MALDASNTTALVPLCHLFLRGEKKTMDRLGLIYLDIETMLGVGPDTPDRRHLRRQ